MSVMQSQASRVAASPSLIQSKIFRHDINGLRAWAVLSVVFYHFSVPGFDGGFIGVDIFFVISGFLMTGIIISGLETGNFSLCQFYLARARRIIPVLLILCTSLLAWGWFWLPNADYKDLTQHLDKAILFISNIKFWQEAGYFDTVSHEKWLLHTWSLSVEWQFYLLLPIFCLLVWHWFGKYGVKITLITIGIVSLFLSIYISIHWPSAAFYLLPTRVWEMLAGGLVWWATHSLPTYSSRRRWATLAEWLGFLLIIVAITTFNSSMRWPGYLALVPVLGTMLVLTANRQNSLLTTNWITHHLGASSYSIYLWHWPLMVLLTYTGQQVNSKWIIFGVFISLILGELSLHLIERPAKKYLSRQSVWLQIIIITTIIIGITIATHEIRQTFKMFI